MAILQKFAQDRGGAGGLRIDSCALTAWFLGQPVDPRMVDAAAALDLRLDHRARLLTDEDFTSFDLLLAVDREVLSHLQILAEKKGYKGQIALATSYSKRFAGQDISDPYYGGPEGFKRTIEIAEDCCTGILDSLLKEEF